MRKIMASVRNVTCGKGVKLLLSRLIFTNVFADNVFVGPFVEVQKGVTIGARTKAQSHSFICEMVSIGSIVS